MTFEELQNANKQINTTDIKGKDYAEVNQRIKVFRMLFPMGSIVTDVISDVDGVITMRAIIRDEENKMLATGTAQEEKSSSFINKTSYVENCETSAVGRALGMLGIGIDTSIASAEEVQNAINNQEEKKPKKSSKKADAIAEADAKAKVLGYMNRHEYNAEDIAKVCKCYKIESIHDMTLQQCQHFINAIQNKGGNIDE